MGAIHCITHTIGVADPLWIVHQKIKEAEANTTITVEAQIKHNSGIASASVFWKEASASTWQNSSMTAVGSDMWEADINLPNTTEDIQYYIAADATSGKSAVRPLVAPEGYWTIVLDGSLGVNNITANEIMGPFPNPATNEVSFRFNQDTASVAVTITNVLGQELSATTQNVVAGTLRVPLQSNWSGALFISLTTDRGTTVRKVIKE